MLVHENKLTKYKIQKCCKVIFICTIHGKHLVNILDNYAKLNHTILQFLWESVKDKQEKDMTFSKHLYSHCSHLNINLF